MSTQFGQKLQAALEKSANDINNFVWKLPRVEGKKHQDEIKLMDATEEQLKQFYTHCKLMLNNKDKHNPGRLVLLDIIKDQREKCNTELFLRYVENTYLSSDRLKIPRYIFLQELREAINNTPNFPLDKLSDVVISSFKSKFDIPDEFNQLTIGYITDGCLNQLGMFNKKHITMSFLSYLGLRLDKAEKKEFYDESRKLGISIEDLIRERCRLSNKYRLRITPYGALTYKEFRATLMLHNKTEYLQMTTDQLKALREKVLFHLETEVQGHIQQWKSRMTEIEAVAKVRNITL